MCASIIASRCAPCERACGQARRRLWRTCAHGLGTVSNRMSTPTSSFPLSTISVGPGDVRSQPSAKRAEVRRQSADLRISHDEDVAENGVERSSVSLRSMHVELGDDYVTLLDQPLDRHDRASNKLRVLDLIAESLLADQMKDTGHLPYDVVSEARQDLCMIAMVKPVDIPLDRVLVRSHQPSLSSAVRHVRAQPSAHGLEHSRRKALEIGDLVVSARRCIEKRVIR